MKSEFVSGLPGDPVLRPTLAESLKKLEAGVKGYGRPGTPASRARDDRLMGEAHENPLVAWMPRVNADEMLTRRLERAICEDTTKAEQLLLL